MTRTIAPDGTWRSPVTPGLLVEQAVRLSDVRLAGEWIYWVESRPAEAGREVIVRTRQGAEHAVVIPPGFSVRTSVHEYGGRCYAVSASLVVFSNWEDQRLWVIREGWGPVAVTRAPEVVRGERFADPVITPDGRQVICVREHPRPPTDGWSTTWWRWPRAYRRARPRPLCWPRAATSTTHRGCLPTARCSRG